MASSRVIVSRCRGGSGASGEAGETAEEERESMRKIGPEWLHHRARRFKNGRMISQPLEEFVPVAPEGLAQPCHYLNTRLLFSCFKRLQITVADLRLFRERLLRELLGHAELHDVLAQDFLRGIHLGSVAERSACDTIYRSYSFRVNPPEPKPKFTCAWCKREILGSRMPPFRLCRDCARCLPRREPIELSPWERAMAGQLLAGVVVVLLFLLAALLSEGLNAISGGKIPRFLTCEIPASHRHHAPRR